MSEAKNNTKAFAALVEGLAVTQGPDDLMVTGLTDDSRQVQPGDLFIARDPAYLAQAVANGAAAVVVAEANEVPDGVACAVCDQVDQQLAGQLADRFYGHPGKAVTLLGITGTNGKTTVAWLVQYLLQQAGVKTGLIGTIHLDTGDANGPTASQLTTPGAIQMRQILAKMRDNGCQAAVMEVSSHALDQGRAAGLAFHAACYTNLTQDHLDYHGTMDAYAASKARLFEGLNEDALMVINADDPWHERMIANTCAQLIRTGVGGQVNEQYQIQAEIQDMLPTSSQIVLHGPWGQRAFTLPVMGEHNISNVVQAVGLAWSVLKDRLTSADWLDVLAILPSVPGRLERVYPLGLSSDSQRAMPTVLVDYAHTPDALSRVTATLGPLTPGRLIVVFGCGGDRDRLKRPLMTQAACDYADVVLLTSDNPRTEDPNQIIADAATGFPQPPDPCPEAMIVPDRAEAIAQAVALAQAGDTVLIAGKGHEDYQILGTKKIDFDDAEHAGLALRKWCSQLTQD